MSIGSVSLLLGLGFESCLCFGCEGCFEFVNALYSFRTILVVESVLEIIELSDTRGNALFDIHDLVAFVDLVLGLEVSSETSRCTTQDGARRLNKGLDAIIQSSNSRADSSHGMYLNGNG